MSKTTEADRYATQARMRKAAYLFSEAVLTCADMNISMETALAGVRNLAVTGVSYADDPSSVSAVDAEGLEKLYANVGITSASSTTWDLVGFVADAVLLADTIKTTFTRLQDEDEDEVEGFLNLVLLAEAGFLHVK